MREFYIKENDAGQRLDRFIGKAVPLLPSSLCQKYIRKKRIKINGKSASQNRILIAGDVVAMYVNDEFFTPLKAPEQPADEVFQSSKKRALTPLPSPPPDPAAFPPAASLAKKFNLNIVFEDENILLLNKPAGILCHSNSRTEDNSLLSEVLRYLQNCSEYDPRAENSFAPALCNRIDRNTCGIVIAAKNAETLRVINEKIRLREIDKYYLAVVRGRPNPPEGKIEGFWTKDKQKNKSTILTNGTFPDGLVPTDAKKVITEYKTLTTRENISLLECKLITGRSHQIRAFLSSIGHPIAGDKKYGGANFKGANNADIEAFQALCSYKLKFSFKTDAKILSYLDGKTFEIKDIPFINTYFGDNFRL